MRKSTVFLSFMALNLILTCLIFMHSSWRLGKAAIVLEEKSQLVKLLKLTDLCLFTEARYTRNPAVADLNTPFQDYPMSFEHYPTGSLMPPPPHLSESLRP